MTSKVHLGPEHVPGGMWRVIFDVPCQRGDNQHGVGVVCEQLSGHALETLKTLLRDERVFDDPPRTWADRQDAVRFLTAQVLRSQGS